MHEHFPLWSYLGWALNTALFLFRFKTGLAYLTYIRAALPLAGIVTLVLFVIAATVRTKPNGSMTRKSRTA